MTKYILAGGYVHKAQDEGKSFYEEMVRGFSEPIKILDCIFARPKELWKETYIEDKNNIVRQLPNLKIQIELAQPETFIEQIKHTNVLYIRGGETKLLFDLLATSGDWTKELDGKTVAGTSAGADIIAKYYAVGKTGRISGEGIGLLPVKFIPHWKSDTFTEFDIDWEQILEGLKKYKEDLPIVALREGEFRVFV